MTARPLAVLCVTAHSDRPETETFIGLRDEGIDVHVMCSPSGRHYRRLLEAGVAVTPFEIARKLEPRAIRRIRAEIERGGYDVLHLFNNKAVLHGVAAARGLPVKVVAYRGIVGNVSLLDPFAWLRYLSPRVDRIVCVAEAVRRHFLELRLLGLRVPPQKLVTIYKGHDLAWYRDPPVSLAALGVPAAAFVIVCVANWRPRKGIEVLLDAFAALPDDPAMHLLLVGDMESPTLSRAIEWHPYRQRIHRIGVRGDAPAVAAAANVAVLPSLKREGLPKTVIEAMAYGVPTIVTNVGGSPELVQHEVSGLVVPPGDARALGGAILRLRGDPAFARALGSRGRQRIVQDFSIRTTIRRTAELYRELVADRGRR
ncbi:MAG TPA: glycosyltransferase family 4 protein [Gammaproteobacteria bacterium]